MKKFLLLLTALSIALSLCACGSKKDKERDDKDSHDSSSQENSGKIPPLSDSVDVSEKAQALLEELKQPKEDAELLRNFDEDDLSSSMKSSYKFVEKFLDENAEDWLITSAAENLISNEELDPYVVYMVWIEGYEYTIVHLTESNRIFTDFGMETLRAGIDYVMDPLYPDLEDSNVTLSVSFEAEGNAYVHFASSIGLFDWEDRDKNPADILNDRKLVRFLVTVNYPTWEDVDLDAYKTFQENVEQANFYNCYHVNLEDKDFADDYFHLWYSSSTKTFDIAKGRHQYLKRLDDDSVEIGFSYDGLHYDYEVEQLDIKDVDLEHYQKVYEECMGEPLDVPEESLTAFKLTKHTIDGEIYGKTAEDLCAGKDYEVVFEEYTNISLDSGFISPDPGSIGMISFFEAKDVDSFIIVGYQ